MDTNTHTTSALKFPARAHQVIDYAGMRYEQVHSPTDIDMLIEYHNRVFIVCEFKLRGAEMPIGQRTTLTHLVDALTAAGKASAIFLCVHDVTDPRKDVMAAAATVSDIYFRGRWYTGRGRTVREQATIFLEKFGKGRA